MIVVLSEVLNNGLESENDLNPQLRIVPNPLFKGADLMDLGPLRTNAGEGADVRDL